MNNYYDPNTSGGGISHGSLVAWAIVLGGFIILVGLAMVAKPDLGWKMRRWQYRNPEAWEPSDAGLAMARLGGVITIISGIVLMVVMINVGTKKASTTNGTQTQPTTPSGAPESAFQHSWGDQARQGTAMGGPNDAPVKILGWKAAGKSIQVNADSGNCTVSSITVTESPTTVTVMMNGSSPQIEGGEPSGTTPPPPGSSICDPGDSRASMAQYEPTVYTAQLASPAGGRTVIDGFTHQPVPQVGACGIIGPLPPGLSGSGLGTIGNGCG